MCGQCLIALFSHASSMVIECPMCRNITPLERVSYAREDETSRTTIKGSFSTKIECVVLKLMELIAEDPKVKVLIFSMVSFSVTLF